MIIKNAVTLSKLKKDPEVKDAVRHLAHLETKKLQKRVDDLEIYTSHLQSELKQLKATIQRMEDRDDGMSYWL